MRANRRSATTTPKADTDADADADAEADDGFAALDAALAAEEPPPEPRARGFLRRRRT
jgi:hypothetical protein